MGIEKIYIKKIEGAIRGVRIGTKNPEEVNIHLLLNGLKKINEGLAEDYLDEYVEIVRKLNNQKSLVS
jgi:hypothetical protein